MSHMKQNASGGRDSGVPILHFKAQTTNNQHDQYGYSLAFDLYGTLKETHFNVERTSNFGLKSHFHCWIRKKRKWELILRVCLCLWKKKKKNWEEEESIYVTCKSVLILDCYLRLTLIEKLNYSPINLGHSFLPTRFGGILFQPITC